MCLTYSDSVKTASGRKQAIMDKNYTIENMARTQWAFEKKR